MAIETVNLTYQPVKILVGATWRHRPHNFLAVGAIAPMESAPMTGLYSTLAGKRLKRKW